LGVRGHAEKEGKCGTCGRKHSVLHNKSYKRNRAGWMRLLSLTL
jgi:hypothetical protein